MSLYALTSGPLPVQRGAAAPGGGTFVATLIANVPATENTLARIQCEIYLSEAIASVLTNAAAFICEGVIANKEGVVTFLPAIATSANPVNSNTAGFALTSRPIASDVAFATATAVLTVDAGGNLLCTVTNNNGGGIPADVTIVTRQSFLSAISGSLVTTWQDQSGAGDPNRDFTQPAVAQRPLWIGSDPKLNGQPSLQFTRVGERRMAQAGAPSNAPIVQPYTMIIVGYDDASPIQQPWVGNSLTNDWYMSSFNSVVAPPNFGSSIGPPIAFANLATDLTDTGQVVIFMTEFNDPASSTIRINSDAPLATQANGTIGAPGFTNGGNLPNLLSLGFAPGTAQNLNGNIAEYMVFDGILSNADREGVETYLQTRYNIPVAGLPVVAPILPTAVSSAVLQCWFRADLGIVPTPV